MEIDADLLAAIATIESSNNPLAYNPKSGARGLYQTTPIAWKDLVMHYPDVYGKMNYEKDIFKPSVSRRAGQDYLNILQRYLINYNLPVTTDNLLAAYNFGIGNIRKTRPENYPKETKDYIMKIKKLMER